MASGELNRADLVMGNARDVMWEMREMQVNHPKGGKLVLSLAACSTG